MGEEIDNIQFLKQAMNMEDFQGLGRRKIWRLINVFLAEFFGTGILVFLGCSTVAGTIFNSEIGYLTICIVFGFAVATAVMLFGHISGTHINPALSVSALICGQISLALCILYTIAQCLGASFGYYLITVVNPHSEIFSPNSSVEAHKACCSVPNDELQTGQIILMEAIGTGILSWAVCSAWDSRNRDKHDSLPVKFAIVIVALAIPMALYSGCSVNPARSFGPALVTGYWDKHWIYWVGPILGSIVTSTIYATVFKPSHMITEAPELIRRDSACMKLRNTHNRDHDDA